MNLTSSATLAVFSAVIALVLNAYPADDMTMWPVDKRVDNVRNSDPSLIEPIELGI